MFVITLSIFFYLFNFGKMGFLLLRFLLCGFAPLPRFWFGQKIFVDADNSLGLIVGLEWREYRFDAPYPPFPFIPLTDDQNPCRGWWYAVVVNDRICRYPEFRLSLVT